jgi:translation initiation factor 3 subunit K
MATVDEMKSEVSALLKGIDRYNPENLKKLERYVQMQCQENVYDLEANLAVLKLYQFNPMFFQMTVTSQILLKALTNLPHTDFTLCKCLIDLARFQEEGDPLYRIMVLADMLETCQFQQFWEHLIDISDLTVSLVGFEDSIRKFICYVIGITYQVIKKNILRELLGNLSEAQTNTWVAKNGWKDQGDGYVFIANQEDNIKTKNITEKITFEGIAAIMAAVSH